MQITVCPFDEFASAPEFDDLVRQYADECAIDGLPRPTPDLATYRLLSDSGVLHTLLAHTVYGELVGFCLVMCTSLPHYSVPVAVSESLFVSEPHRASGAGLALIREAERLSQSLGAHGLLISAPADGRLAEVMSRKPDYRPSNRVFFKGFAQ